MYVKLEDGAQSKLIKECIEKAGGERELESKTGVPKGSIYDYKNEKYNLPKKRFEKLVSFIGKERYKERILNELNDNWGQKKGGRKLIELRKKEGSFEKVINVLKKRSSERMKKWHSRMKVENPEKYYKLQYERFKKIGAYNFKTERGEKVRNELEKKVADYLFSKKIEYEYEPYLKIQENIFFPDFRYDNVILECTSWKGYEKASKLIEKINKYEDKNLRPFVVIPKKIKKYYRKIDKYIVTELKNLPG